jgi:hypothetical protein
MKTVSAPAWPEGKRFAFSIFDDTDFQTLSNVKPVYDFLGELGMRTTKSVWPIRGHETPIAGGVTCEDEQYAKWTVDLQRAGFEIGLHNVTYHTSTREDTLRGFERFRDIYGHWPASLANHTGCREGIYWGDGRLSGMNAGLYNMATLGRRRSAFEGHLEDSPLFWGDVCKQRVQYVRNFVYRDINTLKACPQMPYFDPDRQFVNGWFASSEGSAVGSFVERIEESAQDRLEAEGGACIMYTHLACGFYEDGRLHPRFESLMRRLASKNGWFVPVTTMLDWLGNGRVQRPVSASERNKIERRWLLEKLLARRCS